MREFSKCRLYTTDLYLETQWLEYHKPQHKFVSHHRSPQPAHHNSPYFDPTEARPVQTPMGSAGRMAVGAFLLEEARQVNLLHEGTSCHCAGRAQLTCHPIAIAITIATHWFTAILLLKCWSNLLVAWLVSSARDSSGMIFDFL